jgi:hypothetical protein
MKLARVFCFLIILGSSAVAAFAQTSVDPIVFTKDGPDIPCGAGGEPTCFAGGTLSVDYLTTAFPLEFVYDGMENLYGMTLEFTDVPSGTMFECETNIWTDCSLSSTGTTWDFSMFDDVPPAGLPASCNVNDGVGGQCPGFLAPNTEATSTVTPLTSETPEPGSIILFGTGLITLFGAAKRRFHART